MILLLFGATLLFFFHLSKENKNEPLNVSVLNKKNEPPPSRFDHHLIGKGPLSLSPEIQSFPFPDLSGEVLFLAKNTRPDAMVYEVKLQIGLKGAEKSFKINPGQTLYLAYEKEHLNFSNEVTPLWIKPYLDENGEIWLQMGIQLNNDQGEKLLDEVREFQIKQKWKTKALEEVIDPGLKMAGNALKGGKWWGPDKLFERYGGEEYQKFKERERIELLSDKGKQILFIKEGETFIWKDDKWNPSTETKGYPMGKVMAVSPYKVEWQLWDKGGMESVLLTFNKERSSVISLRIEDVFTKLRRRTSSRVSCRIDNRATILKEGDWLVHTSTGWHTIKNYYEIEALLNLDIQGDLFIFDGLEKTEGKEVFCGTLFNSMRTQEHSVRLPMAQTKSGEHSPPTKNTFSTKIGPLATEEPLTGTPPRNNPNQKLEPIEEYDIFSED
ncbi:MAG: hypothetical protein H7A41_02825 [Chlamydiales bacterium]|nr:hypothetical protein [Chlamydiia bacterium]MCP5504067.1 hypothetical protein [Chlamydiales bacterium]